MTSKFNNSKYSYQAFKYPTNLDNIESGINEIKKILHLATKMVRYISNCIKQIKIQTM